MFEMQWLSGRTGSTHPRLKRLRSRRAVESVRSHGTLLKGFRFDEVIVHGLLHLCTTNIASYSIPSEIALMHQLERVRLTNQRLKGVSVTNEGVKPCL